MRIRGWHVEGFGILSDYSVRDLPDGLVVLNGPNEAGKSTLLTFIRTILFGSGDRRGRMLPCAPLRGGRHGGRLILETERGEVTVERFAEKGNEFNLWLPDGREGTIDDLKQLLGGADAGLFQTVFAFDLSELQEFKSLTAEEIRDKVFSAGIAGAGRSARRVVDTLQARASTLLRERSGKLFDLAKQLNALVQERNAIETTAGAYLPFIDRQNELQGDIENLRSQIEAHRDSKQKNQLLIELWPTWVTLQQASEELRKLDPVDSFPSDAEARLASTTTALAQIKAQLTELQDDLENHKKKRQELVTLLDDRLSAIRHRVQALFDLIALHRNRLNGFIAAEVQSQTKQRDLEQALADLGSGWEESRLKSFDISLPARTVVREWERNLSQSSKKVEEAQREHRILSSELENATAERNRIKESLDTAPRPEEVTLEAKGAALSRLRANLQELNAKQTRAESLDVALRDQERQSDLTGKRSFQLPQWIKPVAFVAAVLLLGMAAWRVHQRDLVGSLLLILFAGILALAGYLVGEFRMRQTGEEDQRQQSLENLREQQQKLRESISGIGQDLEALNITIAGDALILGLNAPVRFDDLSVPELNLAEERQLVSDWDALNLRLKEAEGGLKRAGEREKQAADALKLAKEEDATLQKRWAEWKQGLGIGDLGSPSAVLDFFQQVEKAREQLRLRDEALVKQQGIEEQIADWEKRSRAVLAEAGVQLEETFNGEKLIGAITDLQERCNNGSKNRQAIWELDERISVQGSKLTRAEAEEKDKKQALERLFQEAGVADEETFRAKHEIFKKRGNLKRAMGECETQLIGRFGRGDEADARREELASGNVSSWEQTVRNADSEVPTLETRRDEAIRALERTQLQRERIEQSSDLAAKDSEIASLQEEFATAVREWRVVTLAKGLIEETLRIYAATRQPQVLAYASDNLAAVTNGVYVKVLQDYESQNLIIVDRDGRRKGPDELSRGTAELLYLCLRLGLAAEFGGHGAALPLIMDDVLVNFDPERAGLMISLLPKFVSMSPASGQVLIFTCHPETTELVRRASPECKVIELDRFGIPRPSLAVANAQIGVG